MRLLELRANKESFHTVTFNRSGLSIIQGRKANKQNNEPGKTYNSVGKSLIIRIIHFCLGASPIDEFEEKLPDWEFTLDFDIEGDMYSARRSTNNQKVIFLNGTEYSYKKFNAQLESLVFTVPNALNFLKFRPLLSRFIRPYRRSYESYDAFIPKEKDYQKLLINGYLLGLDPYLITKKYELKQQHDKIDNLRKNISKDVILKKFFDEGRDVGLDITDLEDRINKLESRLKLFIIAEDYDAMRREADEISSGIHSYQNKATQLRNAIRNINKSLSAHSDISMEKIFKFYEIAKFELDTAIKRQVHEVEEFNKKLVADRRARLTGDKNKFERQLKEVEEFIKTLGHRENEKLQYLNSAGALGDYTQLNDQLTEFKARLDKLKMYKDLLTEYKNELAKIRIEFEKENIAANNYLQYRPAVLNNSVLTFKSLAQKVFKDKLAGIEITNNEGENQIRFDINARIQDDAGDGVNQVRLFCFDFTLLKAKHNHNVSFLFHDGRLLSEMDPRQRSEVFSIAYSETQESGDQYIVSVNEDIFDSVKPYLSEEKFSEIFKESTMILELTDESEKSKLLGIEVPDMDYERENKRKKKKAETQ